MHISNAFDFFGLLSNNSNLFEKDSLDTKPNASKFFDTLKIHILIILKYSQIFINVLKCFKML